MSPMDYVEEIPNPDHMHVLEDLTPEDGEGEGKRVEVAPFIGRFLLEHQVGGEGGRGRCAVFCAWCRFQLCMSRLYACAINGGCCVLSLFCAPVCLLFF